MTEPENNKRREPAEAERDDHLKHASQQVTNQHQEPAPEPKEDDLESGDNAAERSTDDMDETTPEGQRSMRDEGF